MSTPIQESLYQNNSQRKPNVILVMTDDQGYADLGCTGNPWIQTPNIDTFYAESVRLSDFHVSPLCTPTRGAIMTGHRPIRNGAWATCWGRSILRKTEVTMANVFADSGYRTGMFGKWHLGDNYPYRPQDRGFQHVVAHKGGGVGQTPDFWGNSYFDDTDFHNSEPVEHSGYCTDVWFDEAMKFIEMHRDEPFFCYLCTNAPHGPYLVEDRYKEPYLDDARLPEPAFYGMITNIDENFGKLVKKLEELGIEDDTILIFMTDNGSSGGCTLKQGQFPDRGYNAGMRGKKGSYYDGGHRVPFFIRWPNGELQGGKDIEDLALHIDLLPTFIDLCGLNAPEGVEFDGVSFAGILNGDVEELPDRTHFLQIRQSTSAPDRWTNAVITKQWRLVHGTQLFDIKADPGQEHDVADQHPEVVAQLRSAHEKWWDEVTPYFEQISAIALGNEAENPTTLCSMDVLGDVAWHQGHILMAQKSTGAWAVEVEQEGTYRFSLRRWPEVLEIPIDAEAPAEEAARIPYTKDDRSVAIQPVKARLKLFGEETILPVESGVEEVTFELQLKQTGVTQLDAWFVDAEGEEQGAYYVVVERLTE